MRKILIIISALLVIILGIVIFKKTEEKETTIAKISLSEVTHSVFYSPLYVAIENGYFKDNNIELELILTPGADKVAASVLSGDTQIGFSGPEATIYVYNNNSNEKIITFASLTKRDGQFIVGDCSLKDTFKMKNLIGKTVLAGRSGGMPLLMFKYALKESNISESNLTIDASIEFAGLTGAFISGQGDFVNLFEPNALNIEKNNSGCVLASLGNISGVVPYTTFYAKESYINENKDVLKRFNKSINEGLNYCLNNSSKDIATSIINQFPGTSLGDLTALVERYKSADSWYENTYVNEKDFEKLIDIMIYGETIDKKIDTDLLITNEFNK